MATFKLEDGTEVEAFTSEEVDAKIAEANSGLESKVKELLGETKSAKEKARELEQAKEQAELDRQKEKGEFKSLYENETKAKLELQEKHEGLLKSIQQKDISLATNSIAAELTKDTSRAKLLAKEVSQYARHTDDGVVFEMGGVQVERDKIVSHISESYPFLIDGSGANGGHARGGSQNGSAEKTVTRSNFDNMDQSQRSEFVKSGGKVVDE